MIVKTELASVEENDDSIRKAIERKAYELYERDGFRDGSDQDHWFRAEKELTIQDATCSIENDKLAVRAFWSLRTAAVDRLCQRRESSVGARQCPRSRNRGAPHLGAARGRIVRQLLTESLVIAFAGAALTEVVQSTN